MEITPIVTDNFLTFDESATLSEMIGKLKQYEKRVGLVFRKKKYLGLVERRRLLKTKIDATKTKIGKFVQNTPIIAEDADVIETAYLMFQSDLDYIPIEKDKKVIGIVKGADLIELATQLPEVKKFKVDDIKFEKGIKIDKEDSLAAAISYMGQHRVDHIPVFDKNKIFGVISYKDIIRKYLNWSPRKDVSPKFNNSIGTKAGQVDAIGLASIPIHSFSTNDNLISVTKGENLSSAIKKMTQNKVSSLLIMDQNKCVGLLAVKNVLRAISSLKVLPNYNIRFVGLADLGMHSFLVDNIKEISVNEASKLQRTIKNEEFSLVIHFKKYSSRGNKHKFSVHIRVEFPSQIISTEQDDWDVITALRKTFNNAKNVVKSKLNY